MNTSTTRTTHRAVARGFRAAAAAAVAASLVLVGASAASAADPVPLGVANSFAVLAGTGITVTGPNTVTGDVGTHPTTSITGAGSLTVIGTNHGGDLVTQDAKLALTNAYTNAAGQGPTIPIAAALDGLTLVGGVYNSPGQILMTGGVLTLDAQGDPNTVFIFQAGSDLIVNSGSSVVLINGAQSCNVFWQVTSSASLGTAASFRGTIMALQSITMDTGATIIGRVLARNGTVTLDTNTITRQGCAVSPTGSVQAGDGSAQAFQANDPAAAGANPVLVIAIAGVGIASLIGVQTALRSRRRVTA